MKFNVKASFGAAGLSLVALLVLAGEGGDPSLLPMLALGLTAAAVARPGAGTAAADLGPVAERREGAWRVLPIEGSFELVYEDVSGARSIRRVVAQELKIGPGKTLLGGVDVERNAYRGFRADRIHLLIDADTGAAVKRNILDWLLKRAERTLREHRKAQAKAA